MQEITNNLEIYGIRNYHTLMDNNEKRFRLISDKDNSSYIRTEGSSDGGFQNSHYHKFFKEMYIVQKGQIDIYEYKDGVLKINKLQEGDYFLINANTSHNVYMYPNSITHTVKFGNSQDNDWYPSHELDELIKNS